MKLISKFSVYTTVSIMAALGFIVQAILDHRQFFPTVVALTNNKPFGIVLANAMLAMTLLFSSVVIWIFFGQLQRLERQRLTELFCYQFIETALALTYFRSSITTYVTCQLVVVSFLKLLHNLCVIRHENLEQQTHVPQLQITKLAFLLAILFQIDLLFTYIFAKKVLAEGVSLSLLLALDFSSMMITCIVSTIRLLLHRIEMRMEREWESKAVLRFYVEIFSDITQCVLFVTFFTAMCRVASLPVHLLRELIIRVGQMSKTLRAFASYKKLASALDKKFVDATQEQIARDPTCAICYDEMVYNGGRGVKWLPCSHCFHKGCLRRWMERHTICPLCRQELAVLLAKAEQERQQEEQQRHQQQQQPAQTTAAGPIAPEGLAGARESDFHEAYRLYRQAFLAAQGRGQQQQQQEQQQQQQQQEQTTRQQERAGTPYGTPRNDVRTSSLFAQEPTHRPERSPAGGDGFIPVLPAVDASGKLNKEPETEQQQKRQEEQASGSTSSPAARAFKAAQDRYLARLSEQQQQQQEQQHAQARATLGAGTEAVLSSPKVAVPAEAQLGPRSCSNYPSSPGSPRELRLAEEVEAYRVYEQQLALAKAELEERLRNIRSRDYENA